jgi:Mn2+/Fe2+ NRAMP family transporter
VEVQVTAVAPNQAAPDAPRRLTAGRGRLLLLLLGPGLMVMLADTDAGSITTAAQSGASWGYQLVLPQLLLIPVLYVVQEITVRLGVLTGAGHGALIRRHYGRWWALLSGAALFVACIGALVTEFAGVAGVGQLAGLPPVLTVPLVAFLLCLLCVSGGYRRVEVVGITLGLLELAFIPAAVLARPGLGALAGGLAHPLVLRHDYLQLLAANVGAVIMPWMVFYQQGAVIDKRVRASDLRAARIDTAVGSVVTQVIMVAVVVATAATVGTRHPGQSLSSIGDIADALVPFLGRRTADVLFGLGMLGAATVAALVVAIAGGWGLSEVLGWRCSLNDRLRHACWFYLACVLALGGSAAAVVAAPNLVNLSVDVQVMNAVLLPVVLGFLLALERRALPVEHRMAGAYKWLAWTMAGLVMAFGVYTAVTVL